MESNTDQAQIYIAMSPNDSESLAISPTSEMRSKVMPQVKMFVDCAELSMSRQDLLDEHHEFLQV